MSNTANRPSPSKHASATPVGTKEVGNDGNVWEVVADKNGTHRWVKANPAIPPSFPPPSKFSGRRYNPSRGSGVSKGYLIRSESGWYFYKTTLPDARVVYSIQKQTDTPSNKSDWQTIKNDMYLNTGFKWGSFRSFDLWGAKTENDINILFDKAAEILGRYYKPKSEQQDPTPAPEKTPKENKSTETDSSKQEIHDAITALEFLADAGDQEAADAITALKYLL